MTNKFKTKFIVASKGAGCKNCVQLEMFLEHSLDGALDKDITFFKEEVDTEIYNFIKEKTGAMQAPIILNVETGAFISGFNPGEIIEFTGVEV